MNIGEIIAGLQALTPKALVAPIASVAGSMNTPSQPTPSQAKEKATEKPKTTRRARLPSLILLLPNQTLPTWGGEPASAILQRLIVSVPNSVGEVPKFWRDIPHNAVEMPMYEVPPNAFFPTFRPDPALRELYDLYFGVRR
jgi:hypothetical protein